MPFRGGLHGSYYLCRIAFPAAIPGLRSTIFQSKASLAVLMQFENHIVEQPEWQAVLLIPLLEGYSRRPKLPHRRTQWPTIKSWRKQARNSWCLRRQTNYQFAFLTRFWSLAGTIYSHLTFTKPNYLPLKGRSGKRPVTKTRSALLCSYRAYASRIY